MSRRALPEDHPRMASPRIDRDFFIRTTTVHTRCAGDLAAQLTRDHRSSAGRWMGSRPQFGGLLAGHRRTLHRNPVVRNLRALLCRKSPDGLR